MSGPTREECEVCGHRHATLSMNGLCGHHIGAGVSATFCRCIHKNGDPADTLRARHLREAVEGWTIAYASNFHELTNVVKAGPPGADAAVTLHFDTQAEMMAAYRAIASLLAALTGEGK